MTFNALTDKTDIPQPAFDNTVTALTTFNTLTLEYAMLLDSQRALLVGKDFASVEMMSRRGDRLARDVKAYGQQLAAVRGAIAQEGYVGPRAQELRDNIAAAQQRAQVVSTMAAQLVAACSKAQQGVAAELRRHGALTSGRSQGWNLYGSSTTGQHRALMIDTIK